MKNSKKNTGFNPENLKIAGVAVRVCAYVIDLAITSFVGLIMLWAALKLWVRDGVDETAFLWSSKGMDDTLLLFSPNKEGNVILCVFMLLYMLYILAYFVMLPATKHQATLGMQLLHIKICDDKGNKMSFLRSFARFIVFKLCLLTFFPLFIILFNKYKRALQDYVCNTYMVYDL